MSANEKKSDDFTSKLENIWDKVSKGVEEGLKVSKDEIVRTAKIGKIRLDIASLKSNKSEKIKFLGLRTYRLLQNSEITIPQLDELVAELKGLDLQIEAKEDEVQTILAEKNESEETKDETIEAELVKETQVQESTPVEPEENPPPKPARKKTVKEKAPPADEPAETAGEKLECPENKKNKPE